MQKQPIDEKQDPRIVEPLDQQKKSPWANMRDATIAGMKKAIEIGGSVAVSVSDAVQNSRTGRALAVTAAAATIMVSVGGCRPTPVDINKVDQDTSIRQTDPLAEQMAFPSPLKSQEASVGQAETINPTAAGIIRSVRDLARFDGDLSREMQQMDKNPGIWGAKERKELMGAMLEASDPKGFEDMTSIRATGIARGFTDLALRMRWTPTENAFGENPDASAQLGRNLDEMGRTIGARTQEGGVMESALEGSVAEAKGAIDDARKAPFDGALDTAVSPPVKATFDAIQGEIDGSGKPGDAMEAFGLGTADGVWDENGKAALMATLVKATGPAAMSGYTPQQAVNALTATEDFFLQQPHLFREDQGRTSQVLENVGNVMNLVGSKAPDGSQERQALQARVDFCTSSLKMRLGQEVKTEEPVPLEKRIHPDAAKIVIDLKALADRDLAGLTEQDISADALAKRVTEGLKASNDDIWMPKERKELMDALGNLAYLGHSSTDPKSTYGAIAGAAEAKPGLFAADSDATDFIAGGCAKGYTVYDQRYAVERSTSSLDGKFAAAQACRALQKADPSIDTRISEGANELSTVLRQDRQEFPNLYK